MTKRQLQIIAGIGAGTAILALLSSCTKVSIPAKAKAVKPFDKDRYLGKWYEIARIDFKYEKGLSKVTAQYVENEDGSIEVINRGYDAKKDKWKESRGKAKLTGKANEARLKVSFFGPFYAGYNVIDIDPDYKYALVAGNDLNYLWLLSRTTSIPIQIKNRFLMKANDIGYDTSRLVWTAQ